MSFAQIRTVWFFMRPYRGLYAAILAVTLAVSVLESVSLAAFFPLFQILASRPADAGGLVGMFRDIVDRMPAGEPLIAACVILGLIIVLKAALAMAREWLTAHASGAALHNLKSRLMRQYADAPYEVFVDTKQGAWLYQCLKAPDTIAFVLLRSPQLLSELLKMAAILVVLASAWPTATAMVVVIGAAYNWLTQQMARRMSYNTGKSRAAAATDQLHVATEFFRGIRSIGAFCAKPAWLSKFEQAGRRYRDLYIQDQVWLAAPITVMEMTAILMLLGAVAAVRLGGNDQAGGLLPMMGVFGVAALRLLHAVTNFGRLRMELAGRLPDVESAHRILTEPPRARRDGERAFARLRDRIQFEEVWFTHRGRPPLLQGVSLTIKQGQTVALIGSSGSGKTTMLNLLLGLCSPEQGRISIDGAPLDAYRLDTWLAHIGLVSQDPFLFHGTIAENIRFGRSGYSDDAVQVAAEIANAHEFIASLSGGYDTVIGERGMKLSGGQQQRLTIARAVLGNPQVLLLDEATSHLDSVSEQQVQDAIERAAQGRTVIIVAHRLSTVKRADWIIVLQEGQVVEEGTHETLLSHPRHYASLVGAAA